MTMNKKNSCILLCMVAVTLSIVSQLSANTITIISPNGGETWYEGSQYEIKWQYDRGAQDSVVNIYFSTTGYNSIGWNTIAWHKIGSFKHPSWNSYL